MSGFVALVFCGCTTSSKFKAAERSDPPIAYEIQRSEMPVEMVLHTVILYKGPGSWKEKALWDEYFLTLTNLGAEPITLTSPQLVDIAGALQNPRADPWELEGSSKKNWKHYQEMGVSLAMGTLGTAVTASGLGVVYVLTGAGATAGAALVALPVVVVGSMVYVQVQNNKNRKAIEEEFERRRMDFPVILGPEQSVTGSLFFPQAPGPQQLSVTYKVGDETKEFVFDLKGSPIAGAHLQK